VEEDIIPLSKVSPSAVCPNCGCDSLSFNSMPKELELFTLIEECRACGYVKEVHNVKMSL
jgi:rubredoxin